MIFGIWPGVAAADLVSLQPLDCPAEDTARTLDALRQLQGTARGFYVRAYRHFGQGFRPRGTAVDVPGRPGLYAGEGRMIDLVACYQSPVPDPAGFAGFVHRAVRDVAACGGGKVQVGEELNMPAPLDGGCPGAFEAIGAGVAAALDERDRHGAPVLVGVNSAGPPDPAFWHQLTDAIGPRNTERHLRTVPGGMCHRSPEVAVIPARFRRRCKTLICRSTVTVNGLGREPMRASSACGVMWRALGPIDTSAVRSA